MFTPVAGMKVSACGAVCTIILPISDWWMVVMSLGLVPDAWSVSLYKAGLAHCCIMSELEIRVRTRLRKRTDIGQILPESYQSAWTDQTCLDHSDQPLRYCNPVYKHRVTIELDPETLQMMQKENVEDACIDVEISDDEVMMMDDVEESDTFEGFESSPLSVPSQTDSPNNATSSPINIPGNSGQEGPRTRRVSSGGTPTHTLSYLGRMFPGAHCDSSPLSSGYGSAPRYFYSAATQTPPSTPVFCETLIRLRISSLSSNPSDGRNQQVMRRRMQDRRSRGRVYSENNGDDPRADDGEEGNIENMEGVLGMPLPDLVAFRDRANSAPSNLMRPEIRVGRQLRRISDEFHLTYYDQQRLRARHQQNILQRLLNSLRGNPHHGHREGSPV
ncbi:uncharacterized protein LOC119744383 isoform X2 [Patiria miniata]|uniref:Bcl-x interacting BH3 domain-containing protein n=1 Tax=Patiria miniata TaxID=46514 RepID=A0A914BJD1_PATMI|nr:uncharacterized protein LOC119744383 isoform X2 [Patiria miniata]